jgi:hypothetical protein
MLPGLKPDSKRILTNIEILGRGGGGICVLLSPVRN